MAASTKEEHGATARRRGGKAREMRPFRTGDATPRRPSRQALSGANPPDLRRRKSMSEAFCCPNRPRGPLTDIQLDLATRPVELRGVQLSPEIVAPRRAPGRVDPSSRSLTDCLDPRSSVEDLDASPGGPQRRRRHVAELLDAVALVVRDVEVASRPGDQA